MQTRLRAAIVPAITASLLGFVHLACGSSAEDKPGDETATGGSASSSGGSASGGNSSPSGGSGGSAPGTGGAPAEVVGATVPFVSFEAENANVGGGASVVALESAPTTRFSSPELESSGHAFIRLDAAGEFVEFENTTDFPVSFVNVRASIPDAAGGKGLDAPIEIWVDGVFRQTLTLTSRQSWGYEGNDHYNAQTQNPSDGNPRTFFDDAHTFLEGAPVPIGGKLRLVVPSSNAASFYDIDVVDVENPPAAKAAPEGSLSITECGAKADDPDFDSSSAIQSCIGQAASEGRVLFIPKGTFTIKTTGGLDATGITIVGAGMWYSRIYRAVPLPNGTPLGAVMNLDSCHVKDFAIDSNALSRDSVDGCGGGMDTTGTNWSADGIWTQHTMSGFWASGTGGSVKNCRLLSIWADGCNVNNVSRGASVGKDLVVENNFVRGTGDDAIAINSVDYNGETTYTPMSNVTVKNNTSLAMWGGKGVSIYGGSGHLVSRNYMAYSARYIGLGVGKFGENGSDLESATVEDNVVEHCGGNAYEQGQPALHIGNGGDGHGTGTVENAIVRRNVVRYSLFNGVGFSTSAGIEFSNNVIENPGRNGIVISPPFYDAPTGSAAIENNTVSGVGDGYEDFVNNSSEYVVTTSGNSFDP